KTMLGTWLAVKYAEVRQLVPTVCASAYCLAKPVTRASTVIAPMTSAPPATPRASLAFRPPEGSRVNGSDVNGSRVGGAAAQHVDPVEHLVARDDLGEADLLRGGGERGHGAEQREPAGTAQLGHGGQAQQRAERVGAGVAEHGPLAQVVGEQRGRGAERHGGQRRRGGRVSGPGRRQQRPAGEQPDLDSPAGPQVEQVGQVGRARDGGAVDERVGGAARDERGGAQPGRADAEDLDGAAGDLAPGESAQVAFEAFGGGGAVEVVV